MATSQLYAKIKILLGQKLKNLSRVHKGLEYFLNNFLPIFVYCQKENQALIYLSSLYQIEMNGNPPTRY